MSVQVAADFDVEVAVVVKPVARDRRGQRHFFGSGGGGGAGGGAAGEGGEGE